MYFLAVQNSFHECTVALFQKECKVASLQVSNHQASSQLILMIETLLADCALHISDIAFLAVHTGPAPYTALRTSIALVNGIGYATGIPLVPVDGLQALLMEYNKPGATVLALLNAFNNDLFYMYQHEKQYQKGCKKTAEIVEMLKSADGPVHCIGNGTALYADILQQQVGSNCIIPIPLLEICSIDSIALLGYQSWISKKFPQEKQLSIGYLKAYTVL